MKERSLQRALASCQGVLTLEEIGILATCMAVASCELERDNPAAHASFELLSKQLRGYDACKHLMDDMRQTLELAKLRNRRVCGGRN